MIRGIKAVLLLFFLPFIFFAHEFNPAHLVVKEVDTNIYETKWMYPVKNIGARGEVVFPNECLRENTNIEKNGRYLVESFSLTCATSIKGKTINVRSLSVLTDALITVNHLDATNFEGLIKYDPQKLSGQNQRIMDTKKMDSLGWVPSNNLKTGIEKTVNWFKNNRSIIREK